MLTALTEWLKENFLAPDAGAEQRAINLAAAALLFEIARADQQVSALERDTMAAVLAQTLALTAAEAQELLQTADPAVEQAVSLTDFTRLLNEQLAPERRLEIIEALWRVAWADGNIDKYEEYYIRKISDLLYIPHSQYIRAKLRVLGTP